MLNRYANYIMMLILSGFLSVGFAENDQQNQQRSVGQYLDDASMIAKIKVNFLKNSQISSDKITINVFKGNVQLSGFVKSPEEADEVIRIAAKVEGVKGIIDSLNVITNDTFYHHTPPKDPNLKFSDQNVSINSNQMMGHQDKTNYDNNKFQQISDTIDNSKEKVQQYSNNAGKYMDDAKITSKIKLSLLNCSKTSALKIKVTTEKGIVTLSGDVNSKEEKADVEKIAKNTQGVRMVISELVVR